MYIRGYMLWGCWIFSVVTESFSKRIVSFSLIFVWCVAENENGKTKEKKYCVLRTSALEFE